MPVSEWLSPLLVGTGITVIGWMLRYIFGSITDKLDTLDSTFAKVTGELAREHAKLAEKLSAMDRRVVRLESWKDLLGVLGHAREHDE